MNHIPHITISTNNTLEEAIKEYSYIKKECSFSFKKGYHIYESMYENDLLKGSGFYCDVEDMDIKHNPHMTIFYDTKQRYITEPKGIFYGYTHIVDTRNLDLSKWYILTT